MQLDVDSDASFSSFLPGAQQDDRACYAVFKIEKKLMGFKSNEAGRPIYEDREYVQIMVKGQDKQVFWREVCNEDRSRFPNAYAAFRKGVEAPVIGTPVEMLGLGPSSVEMLRTKGIRTAEDIAALSDESLQALGMGGRELQGKAKAFLGKTSEQTVRLERELAAEKTKTVALQAQMDALQEQVRVLAQREVPKPKRGQATQARAAGAEGAIAVTMLTIVQAIADEVGVFAPNSVAGSQDRTAKQLLRLVNRAGKRLARKPWPILQTEHVFTTVASTAAYDLPLDFSELLSDTVWDRTNYWQLRGGLTPQEWQVRKSAITVTVTTRKRFRVMAQSGVKKFFIDPTPDAAESLVFEYLSDAWARASGTGVLQNQFSADTDESLLPEELLELSGIWRFRYAKGLDYGEARKEFDEQVEAIFGAEAGAGAINLGRVISNDQAWRMNIPESGFGS